MICPGNILIAIVPVNQKAEKKLGVKRLVVLKCAYKARRRAKALVFALAPNHYANRMREQALVRKVHQRRSSSKALPIEREPAKNIKHTEKKAGKNRLKKRNDVSGEVSFFDPA